MVACSSSPHTFVMAPHNVSPNIPLHSTPSQLRLGQPQPAWVPLLWPLMQFYDAVDLFMCLR